MACCCKVGQHISMKLDQQIIAILRENRLSVNEIGNKLKIRYGNLPNYLQNMVIQGRLRREGNPWIYSLNVRGM